MLLSVRLPAPTPKTQYCTGCLYGLSGYALQLLREQDKERVLTVDLPPREVVLDRLLGRIQDDSSVKRWRILQADPWEMFCPVEHVRGCKLGYNGRQYFCLSSVVNAGRFFEQEAGRVKALQLLVLDFSDRDPPA